MENRDSIFHVLKIDERERILGLAIEDAEKEGFRALMIAFIAMGLNGVMLTIGKLYFDVDFMVSIGIVLLFIGFLLPANIILLEHFIYRNMSSEEVIDLKKDDSK